MTLFRHDPLVLLEMERAHRRMNAWWSSGLLFLLLFVVWLLNLWLLPSPAPSWPLRVLNALLIQVGAQ